MTKRRGFTLLEMVVAIMIISLLAGGLFLAGRAAISFFRGVNEKGDLGNVAKALEIYKNKYGEYPPDGTSRDAVRRHLLKRYPDLLKDKGKIDNLAGWLSDISNRPQVLTYWLCGENWTNLPDDCLINEKKIPQTGETDIIEVKAGFKDASDAESRRPQSGVNYNISKFYLCNARGDQIVYFKAEAGLQANETASYEIIDNPANPAVDVQKSAPYLRYCVIYDSTKQPAVWRYKWMEFPQSSGDPINAYPWLKASGWYAPDTYQLILPGEDGVYNTSDDVTNFCSGKTMAEEEDQ